MRQWLPIGCVLVLLAAVAFVATRQRAEPQAPPSAVMPGGSSSPTGNQTATSERAPSAPNAGAGELEPLVNPPTLGTLLRSVVGLAPPIPVVDGQPEAAAGAAVTKDPAPVVEPAMPVAATIPVVTAAPVVMAATVPQAPAPAGSSAPASPSTTPGWRDNAPSTALEDAATRNWPYPPMLAPATTAAAPTDPLLAPADPTRKEQTDPLAGWGPPPAPSLDPRRFTEAHWQGIEVIPNTPLVAKALGIPADAQGVIADDVTLPADLQGFKGGDLVMQVNGVPTADLTSFIDATDRVRDLPQAELLILRKGEQQRLLLKPLNQRLGTANGETASMIRPGARMPHPYRGPCTNCHRIGTTGTIPIDQGDMMVTAIPTIRADAVRPHRDRGPCRACHQILP